MTHHSLIQYEYFSIKSEDFIVICSFVDDLSIFASNVELIKQFTKDLFKIYKGTEEEYLNILSNQHGNDLKHARQERYLQIGRSGLFSDTLTTANSVLDEKYGKASDRKKFKNSTTVYSSNSRRKDENMIN